MQCDIVMWCGTVGYCNVVLCGAVLQYCNVKQCGAVLEYGMARCGVVILQRGTNMVLQNDTAQKYGIAFCSAV
jgi:hypothetical protein